MEQSFTEYLNAVENHIEETFLLPLDWAPVDPAIVAGGQEDGWTSEQFAAWLVKSHGYTIHSEPLSPSEYLDLYIALTLRD